MGRSLPLGRANGYARFISKDGSRSRNIEARQLVDWLIRRCYAPTSGKSTTSLQYGAHNPIFLYSFQVWSHIYQDLG